MPLDFAARLHRPGFCPERNIIVAEMSGEAIAYLEMTPELAISRMVLNCWVPPAHRRRGLAGQFLRRAVVRAKELGIKQLHACVTEDNTLVKEVLAKLGFRYARRFLEMSLKLAHFSRETVAACPQMRPGEESELTRVQNRAFAGTWGFNPNSLAQITYRCTVADSGPEDVMLCRAGGEVVGYCWTRVTVTEAGKSSGRIFMLGVVPEYRGKGIGQRVLLTGLSYLKDRGVGEVVLSVDSENSAAIALYRAEGFVVKAGSLWYERSVA